MNYSLYKKQRKISLAGNSAVSAVLFAAGMVTDLWGLIALACIPLALALISGIFLIMLKKYPKKMLPFVIAETDVRIRSEKQSADSVSLRLLRWVLLLVFFGYTFLLPDELFISPMWWITASFLVVSYLLPPIIARVQK